MKVSTIEIADVHSVSSVEVANIGSVSGTEPPAGGTDIFYSTAREDDGYYNSETGTMVILDNGLAFGGAWAGAYCHGFLRFTGVDIPQGSTITSAYMRFQEYLGASGNTTCNLNFYFENADNPNAPTTWVDMDGRTKTSAVAWNNVGVWTIGIQYDTPDLSSILQTVINRAGFAGNAVIAYVYNNASSNMASRSVRAIDAPLNGLGGYKPELHVVWT